MKNCRDGKNCKWKERCKFKHSLREVNYFKNYKKNFKFSKPKKDLRFYIDKKTELKVKDEEIEHMRKFLTQKVVENTKQEEANIKAQLELENLRKKNQIMAQELQEVKAKISRLESLRKKK